jgi:uncharacterized FlaG/YvyC family protein
VKEHAAHRKPQARTPEGRMAYETVGAVTKIDMDIGSNTPVPVAQTGKSVKAVEVKPPEPTVEKKEPVIQKQASAASVVASDVRLRFIVNPESDHVTIVVVDRASKKIIRTIPPEEFNQIKTGDLIELIA